jgi:hypothetical protein
MERSWAWWCVPVIAVMVGRVKQKDRGPGQPEQKNKTLSPK